MKTTQISLILLCLSLLTGTGNSQIDIGMMMERQQEMRRARSKEASKDSYRRVFWDHGGTETTNILAACLRDPKLRAELSVSDEYYQEIQSSESNARDAVGRISDNLEYQKAKQEYSEAIQTVTGYPLGSNSLFFIHDLDEEKLKAFNRSNEIRARMESMQLDFDAEVKKRTSDAISNAITPELKQKFLEMQLVGMMLWGETTLSAISPSKFEALNLTDAQRQQIEHIRNELEPEFEKCIELSVECTFTTSDKLDAGLARRNKPGEEGRGKLQERYLEALKEMKEDPEYKKILEASQASTRTFATLFKTRMSDILTDEQRKRLQELIDNPPLHVRLNIQRGKELLGETADADEKGKSKNADSVKDVWVPGPDSWKPGDPLPEWFRQERNTRGGFPREEN
jgi:hypothetical protein